MSRTKLELKKVEIELDELFTQFEVADFSGRTPKNSKRISELLEKKCQLLKVTIEKS